MRDALKGVVAGVLIVALLGAIASRAGWIVAAVPRPEGTGAWRFSRATGLLAYLALSLDVIAGLAISTRSGDRWIPRGQLVDLHRWLSPLALACVLAHGGILVADGYARFDVIDLAVPFASTRWSIPVGLGILAGYLALVVHLSFALRKRIGVGTWRRLHYVSFVAFALVTVHAWAGTDRFDPWFVAVYLASLGAIVGLLAVRIARARGGS